MSCHVHFFHDSLKFCRDFWYISFCEVESQQLSTFITCITSWMCVCVCVWARGRVRERGGGMRAFVCVRERERVCVCGRVCACVW
jgi:hypothetical protein